MTALVYCKDGALMGLRTPTGGVAGCTRLQNIARGRGGMKTQPLGARVTAREGFEVGEAGRYQNGVTSSLRGKVGRLRVVRGVRDGLSGVDGWMGRPDGGPMGARESWVRRPPIGVPDL